MVPYNIFHYYGAHIRCIMFLLLRRWPPWDWRVVISDPAPCQTMGPGACKYVSIQNHLIQKLFPFMYRVLNCGKPILWPRLNCPGLPFLKHCKWPQCSYTQLLQFTRERRRKIVVILFYRTRSVLQMPWFCFEIMIYLCVFAGQRIQKFLFLLLLTPYS